MGISRQEYWQGLPFPSPGNLPNPGIKPTSPESPALAGRFFTAEPPRKPHSKLTPNPHSTPTSLPSLWGWFGLGSIVSDPVRPHRQQPTRFPRPWDSPGKNTGVGCHFLLQCRKVKSESEVAQSYLTLSDPMDCSLPGFFVHGIFQARVLEWGAIAFSGEVI